MYLQRWSGHKFKDDREVEKVATLCLITQDTDFYEQKKEMLAHDKVRASVVAKTMRKISGIAVQ